MAITDNYLFAATESPSVPLIAGHIHHEGARFAAYGHFIVNLDALHQIINGVAVGFFRNSEAVAAAGDVVYIMKWCSRMKMQ